MPKCCRYLCSGMDTMSLQYLYKLSQPSISRIIKETCGALWDALAVEFLKLPAEQQWERIAEDFVTLRDFPNCVGCIDGKHVENTAGVFEITAFGQMLLGKTLPLPCPKILPDTNVTAPHVFLGMYMYYVSR